MDGASAEECGELLAFLPVFEEQAEILGVGERYRYLRARCRFHFTKYRQYLESEDVGKGYAYYLRQKS
jgi:hypothetical protein